MRSSRSACSVTDNLELFGSYGFTDSKITDMEDPSVIGNQAPLVSEDTFNLGAQWRQPLGDSAAAGAARRLPARRRDLVGAVQCDLARSDRPASTCASGSKARSGRSPPGRQNLTDEEYNAEFSPGGFLFRALPLRYGLEFSYSF